MSLLSGGDTNSNTCSGWGPPPPPPSSSSGWSSASGWNSNNNRPQTNGEVDQPLPKTCSSWAQAVSSGPNPQQSSQVQANTCPQGSSATRHAESNSKDGRGHEEAALRSIPESLLTDDWGQTVINQDKSWDLPPSPQESKFAPKDASKEMQWESVYGPAKTGTELWESSVRSKTGVNSSSMTTSASSAASSAMLSSSALTSSLTQAPLHSNNPGQTWNQTHTPASNIGGTWGEEEETPAHWTGVPNGSSSHSISSNSNASNGSWGGKVEGQSEWRDHAPRQEDQGHHHMSRTQSWANTPSWERERSTSQHHSLERSNPSGWAPEMKPQPWKKESVSSSSGWDEETMNGDSNGTADDGTAVWGNPVRNQQPKVRKWSDEPEVQNAKGMMMNSANGNINTPPQGLLPSSPGMVRLQNKPNDWANKPQGGWEPGWERSSSRNWDGGEAQGYWSGPRRNPDSWSDGQVDTSSWNGKQKPLTKEMIWASKPFRILTEQGYKKEEAEQALRATGMDLEEAVGFLRNCYDKKSPVGNTSLPSPSSSLLTSGTSSLGNRGNSALPSVLEVTSVLRRTPRQTNLPSDKQLIHLVKEIQLAVQSGHLQAQILNQPLAHPTVQLIYSLLQQIKLLQQLQAQVSKPGFTANPAFQSQANVQITQTKLRIQGLQNQISASQAHYMKQTASSTPRTPTDMNPLADFADLNLNKDQSRFETTWKKTDEDLLRKTDWASESWSDGNDMVLKDNSAASTQSSSSYMPDLGVPEFEPGKPWKGSSQLKSIEDDPHMTPGSVNRSPLAVSFNNWSSKVSPTEGGITANESSLNPLSLSSSATWAFSTPSSSFSDPLKAAPTSMTDSWTNNSKPRGPPPGLSQSSLSQAKASGVSVSSTGQASFSWSDSSSGRWEGRAVPGFLVLTNLTPQMDGATLKTLCMQHGPLKMFQLSLNTGSAIVQYSSHEEATKAQAALNNCVIGNTNILSHTPSEAELQQVFQQQTSNWNQGTVNGAMRCTSGMGFNSNKTEGNWSPSSGLGWGSNHTTVSSPGSVWASSGLDPTVHHLQNLDDLLGESA